MTCSFVGHFDDIDANPALYRFGEMLEDKALKRECYQEDTNFQVFSKTSNTIKCYYIVVF